MTRYCEQCGAEADENARFCLSCGTELPERPKHGAEADEGAAAERGARERGLTAMQVERLRHPGERAAFILMLVLTAILVLVFVVVTLGLGIIIAILAVPGSLLGAWLRGRVARGLLLGSHPRVTPENYAEIHALIRELAHEMGIGDRFETYIVQETTLNAFFRAMVGTKHMVLYSHLVEAMQANRDQLRAIIAHELAHLRAGHFRLEAITTPWRIIPWVYNWWSRSCEYTCDRIALHVCGYSEECLRAVAKLAAGPVLGDQANLDAMVQQANEATASLAATFVELSCSHPLTLKRIKAMHRFAQTARPR